MNFVRPAIAIIFLITFINFDIIAAEKNIQPVSPNASPEAKALLELIYSISEKYTLSGQHNYPNTHSRNSRFAENYMGSAPVIWSTDMGFAKDGDTDSYLARPDIVKEAIRQHQMGNIVTLCWHAVPPTADEPVTFRPLPCANPKKLESVQGRLTDEQFEEILTPGTPLNKKWIAQVDTVAYFLKQLRDAHVPVLWRPYHEMNGNWFWWGDRIDGQYTTKALYLALFNRLVNYHKLNNLIWVWNVDRPHNSRMDFANYYPGNEYLDILSIDIYGNDFNQKYYDGLKKLANGKPLAFGEVGNPPAPEILDNQPDWCYWVVWAGMVRNTTNEQYNKLKDDSRVLFQADNDYSNEINRFRKKCNLPGIDVQPNAMQGIWFLNEEKSKSDEGFSNLPYKIKVIQTAKELMVERTSYVEWSEDNFTFDIFVPDGKTVMSEVQNNPVETTISWNENHELVFDSKTTFTRGSEKTEVLSKEIWKLENDGKTLRIEQTSSTPWGNRNSELVFEKK
ncbi:MAG TPA: glycosyl hydrolase [Prolixibacteraceae bacterium]|nr:glycosyl hydrolase [Prolixibacteraceae bacterium]